MRDTTDLSQATLLTTDVSHLAKFKTDAGFWQLQKKDQTLAHVGWLLRLFAFGIGPGRHHREVINLLTPFAYEPESKSCVDVRSDAILNLENNMQHLLPGLIALIMSVWGCGENEAAFEGSLVQQNVDCSQRVKLSGGCGSVDSEADCNKSARTRSDNSYYYPCKWDAGACGWQNATSTTPGDLCNGA